MSQQLFRLVDRGTPPAALTAAHSTLPQQSIYVLHDHCSEELKLVRLLLGTVKVAPSARREWIQRHNFSLIGAPSIDYKSHKKIDVLLAPFSISAQDLDKHFRTTLKQRGYYSELLAEVLHYFDRQRAGQHALAFLHLYRFLEHVSFAFPLLYAARTTDFSNAFTALKDFFNPTTKGELKFFEKFVEKSVDAAIRNQTIRISISGSTPAATSGIYSVIRRQFAPAEIISEVLDTEIEIRCEALSGLCVNLRNRFFHFLATEKSNISLNEIWEPDDLFECVNRQIFNWLSVLFFETLRHRVHAPI